MIRAKKAGSTEPLSEKSVSSLAELAALEERLADLAKDTKLPDEMTGMEEGNVVATKLAKMRSIVGFREVAKFKRRSRYLEFFVIVRVERVICTSIMFSKIYLSSVFSCLCLIDNLLSFSVAFI